MWVRATQEPEARKSIVINPIPKIEVDMIPQFSILMANYNNGRFIDEAIRSVLAQTFTNWELVIVDDASKDDSLKRIEPYLDDPRIRLYTKKKNEGYTKALIYGLTKISSEIVGILDSDDALVPDAIEKVHRIHTERPELGLVLSQAIECDSNLKARVVTSQRPQYQREPLLWMRAGGAHFRSFKVAAYNKTAGLDPRILYAEDWDLLFKLEEVAPAWRTDDALYMHRYHSNSLSHAPESHLIGLRSLSLAIYRAHLRRQPKPNFLRQSSSLASIPTTKLLARIVTAVEYSLDLREPWQAVIFALRGLRVAPLEGAAWRNLIKSVRAYMSLPETKKKNRRVSEDMGFVRLRSFPVSALQSNTGNNELDRVVCIPLVHREGHCLFGGDYLILEGGRYNVKFEIAMEAYSFAQDPLVVLDVYENVQTRTVQAQRQITSADLPASSRWFSTEFSAKEGQCVEFRVYWAGQCFLTVTGVILQKARW